MIIAGPLRGPLSLGLSAASDNIVGMRYGLDISPAGDWGRPDQLAELAALADGAAPTLATEASELVTNA